MIKDVNLTHTSALILQTISAGYRYGFEIMEATGLPSGTVYPALRRLEESALISSKWEKEKEAAAQLRPPRKYFKLTRVGDETLAKAVERYPLLQRMGLEEKPKHT
ncbi:MAG: helix-turn-helix transcriptional regulator [Bryobacteraceae bacterium]|jgi:PadR family transcriptional regulator